MAELTRAGMLTEIYHVAGVGPTDSGRNGGGDRYFTDGEMTIGVIRPDAATSGVEPRKLRSPPPGEVSNSVWSAINKALAGRAN
jgi:hypothetical protein